MSQKYKLDFSEFFPIPNDKWISTILKELSLQKKEELHWEHKNLSIPKASSSHNSNASSLRNFHRQFTLKYPRHWYTTEHLEVQDPAAANILAQHALICGADSLSFHIRKGNFSYEDAQILLNDIYVQFAPVTFQISENPEKFCRLLSNMTDLKGSLKTSLLEIHPGSVLYSENIEALASSIKVCEDIPQFRNLHIDTAKLHEAGISPEIEIAFAIAAAIDIIDLLEKRSFHLEEIISRMAFSFSVGKSFFMEIAKLRAFRFLWDKVIRTMKSDVESFSTPVHCTTASHFFSKDPYCNILHNTTEALTAVLGGCDYLTILPFDINQKGGNSFSSRISRNISLLLKEESFMTATVDPAGGSYTIETMTQVLAEKSLHLLKEIENKGGLSKAITMLKL